MANFSIIKKSQLEGATRIDANFYQPEYFIDLTKGKWKSIGSILKKCQYGLSLAMNDKKIGYPMFKMDNIEDAFLLEDDVRYVDISKETFENFKLEKNNVFFNRVNSEEFVGRTGIYKLNMKSTFASYLIRLQPDEAEVLPDYLNIFINSKFGLRQIKKYSRRAVNQANVNAEELKQFKIAILPMFVQKGIEKLSNESWEEFQNSKLLYQQAENLLVEELGLKGFDNEEKLSVIINFSEIELAHRMDAEYFQDRFSRLLDKISKNAKVVKLEDIAEVKRGSQIDPVFYNDQGTPYLRGKDFSSGEITSDSLIYIKDNFKSTNETRVYTGDLIFASIGSVGTLALVTDTFDGSFISNNTAKISISKKDEIIPDYFDIVMQSIIGKSQFEKESTQTAQPKIADSQVKRFSIPILPKETQKKISELVIQSHEARKKAKELLEEAKRKVEEMIEKGGEV